VTSSELNDDDLLSLSAAELNYRLELLSPSECLRLKKHRRTLQNSHYQQTYQKRRSLMKYSLQHTSDGPVAQVKVSELCSVTVGNILQPARLSLAAFAFYGFFLPLISFQH